MELLLPLGLLGLVSILALIIIYIIKPNYIVKHVSTTYVWELSLRYQRRRIHSSTLKKVLLFLCQVLILALIAILFTQPVFRTGTGVGEPDVIAVIDSSASMYTGSLVESGGETYNETRFQRALKLTVDLANETAANGGNMTVIIADGSPEFLARRVPARSAGALISDLQNMIDEENSCSFGVSDIDGAIELCNDVLAENPAARVYLYTDTNYTYIPERVTVVPVSREGEWNVGILNAHAEIEEGYYALTVELAAYGESDLSVDLAVQVVLLDSSTRDFSKKVFCENGVVNTVVFCYGGGMESDGLFYCDLTSEERFSSFRSIHISVNEADSFRDDNSFNVFGGDKEIVRIQYATGVQNPFFPTALNSLIGIYEQQWDIRITEVDPGVTPQTTGYDLYIFDHIVPNVLPRDGAVLFCDPASAPTGSGFTVLGSQNFNGRGISLSQGVDHPVLKGLNPDNMRLWEAWEVTYDETLYEPLLYCNNLPVLLCANHQDNKIAVMAFNLNRSNIVLEYDFLLLLSNLFGYYFPSTVEKYAFEVGEEIEINARGPEVYVKGQELSLKEFPAKLVFDASQIVTIGQRSYFRKEYPDIQIYIKLPAAESNIWRTEDELADPYADLVQEDNAKSLNIYFAAALLALLLLEWWLQSRESQ